MNALPVQTVREVIYGRKFKANEALDYAMIDGIYKGEKGNGLTNDLRSKIAEFISNDYDRESLGKFKATKNAECISKLSKKTFSASEWKNYFVLYKEQLKKEKEE